MDIKAYAKAFLSAYVPYKKYWNDEDNCVLKGCVDLYQATGDQDYKDFVLKYLESCVMPDGSIAKNERFKFIDDSITCSKALYFALDETGDERYRKAIEQQMASVWAKPRLECGNFASEMDSQRSMLGDLYFTHPFYMEYESRFDGMAKLHDITSQFKNARRMLWKDEKGLNGYGYSEAEDWLMAGMGKTFKAYPTGLHLMALIDCIELCSEMLYEHYRALVDIFRESIRGVMKYQRADGLFGETLDAPAGAPNDYTETAGSAMIAYCLFKAVRLGVLNDEKYLPAARRMFASLVDSKFKAGDDGKLHLMDITSAPRLSPEAMDECDLGRLCGLPCGVDSSIGVGPFMMAWAEYLKAEK